MYPTRPEGPPGRRREIPFWTGGIRVIVVETLVVLAAIGFALILASIAAVALT